MKSFFISISMMLMTLMASAQQVVNVEFLDGDLDNDNKITTGDVTGLIDTYLTNEEPRKTVSVTIDNSELETRIAKNTEWIDYFLKNQYFGINEDEVQKMIEDYMVAHPGLSVDDVNKLIRDYLQANPSLSANDVETIAEYVYDKYPRLTQADVETIVKEWIYDHQILNRDQVCELIEKALSYFALKSDVPTQSYIEDLISKALVNQQQTIDELKATIEELKKEINNLKNGSE
ncbi:MAG: hypothetical protein IJT97_09345 [Bacteroidaceae bacterium]|nr:hypothetical protein [Bacteroidaceae bacterium]